MDFWRKNRGQSLIEAIIAVAVGAAFLIAGAGIIAPALKTSKQTRTIETQTELGKELLDDTKVWATANWNNLLALATSSANQYHLLTAQSPFSSATGTEPVVVATTTNSTTTYQRYFYLSDAYRTSAGNLTTTASGNYYDPSAKLVTAVTSNTSTKSAAYATTTMSEYLTRYANNIYDQSDWSGGPGQNNPVAIAGNTFATSTNMITSAAGQLTLSTITTTTYNASGTLDSATFGVGTGIQLNSVMWLGSTSTSNGTVKFQFAVSNTSASSTLTSFLGPDGTSLSYFGGTNGATEGTPISLVSTSTSNGYSLVSGYPYFRYRITLFSNASNTGSPIVNQVIINWSP